MPSVAQKSQPKSRKTTVKKRAPETAKAVVKKAVKGVAKAKKKPLNAKPSVTPAARTQLEIGTIVPAFDMAATKLGKISSAALKGKPYLIYFYPKDDTSGCTAEACAFRDGLPSFAKTGLTVIGVSRDSLASHEKFAAKYNLTFPLASDEDGAVCDAFGVWVEKSMYGRKYMGIERSSFLIDAAGKIAAVWRKVAVPGHADEVKKAVAAL
jgi:peroxiredoxin Q/BCP